LNKKNEYYLFNKKVKKERWEEIQLKLYRRLNGWHPEFNNLKYLYLKSGLEWKKTPIPKAEEVQKEEAWKDMPKVAVEYLASLPEFDKKIFEGITGIEVNNEN
jgi:hypothetical protein